MANDLDSPAHSAEPRLEASRGRAIAFAVISLIIVVSLGFIAVKSIGGSVLYYKTPTELLAEHPNYQVRLAGKLVKDTQVAHDDGTVTFDITDGRNVVHVRYAGGATTALQSASRPGASMVAEGTLDAGNIFQAVNLLAKCPSKFASSEGSTRATIAALS